jgi:2-C-methyl-D-erythritol 4-phosphate cytidylyltransferase
MREPGRPAGHGPSLQEARIMGKFAVLLPAAGSSRRFGDPKEKKIYADLGGRAVWLRAVEPFVNREDVGRIVLAIHPDDRELFDRRYGANEAFLGLTVIEGGAERVDSVAAMLREAGEDCDFVAVHDAARPFPPAALIDAVFAAAREHGAALPGLAVSDTLKRADDAGVIRETVPRAGLYAVQTPQAFRRDLLERAYAGRDRTGAAVTDDAMLVEAAGHPCRIVPGSPFNLKITTRDDLAIARAIVGLVESRRERPSRLHPFADERAEPAQSGPTPRPEDLFS